MGIRIGNKNSHKPKHSKREAKTDMCRLSAQSGSQCPPLPLRSRQLKEGKDQPKTMSSYKDELIRRGIDCRISTGSRAQLIFYGPHHETDCRGAGMKRFSMGVDGDGSHYIYTWGQTEREIINENLGEWTEYVKKVCSDWEGIESVNWRKEWRKKGKSGGFTCRFLYIDNLDSNDLYQVINKLTKM